MAKGASTSREEGVEDERDQLIREISSFEGKRAEVSEEERRLETIQCKPSEAGSRASLRKMAKKRKLEEQLTSLRLEVEQAQQNMPAKRKRLKDVCTARKVENTQRLDKLPQEVWEKIFGNLDENDVFPLALSCRFFRQKQEELGNRLWSRQKKKGPGSKPFFPLETNLRQKLEEGTPASAEYLQFCIEEKSSWVLRWKKKRRRKRERIDECIRRLAAFHGHLPLLQELLKSYQGDYPLGYFDGDGVLEYFITCDAARGGQLETLKWLSLMFEKQLRVEEERRAKMNPRELEGYEPLPCMAIIDTDAFVAACKGGHLEIMKWLKGVDLDCLVDCISDSECAQAAAKGGHLEALKWLRSEGFRWDAKTVTAAANGGHLEVIQWAIDSGCPYRVNHTTRPALESLGYLKRRRARQAIL